MKKTTSVGYATLGGGFVLKIRDRWVLGVLSGVLAAIPVRFILNRKPVKGFTDRRYSPRFFLSKRVARSRGGRLLGNVMNNVGAGATGILLSHVLSRSGRKRVFVKGMAVGTASWVGLDGYAVGGIFKGPDTKPLGPALALLNHAVFGGLTALLVSILGHDELFPPREIWGFGDQQADERYREIELRTSLLE